jgi:gamma-glutamyl:cysteine ligase YbdK (ATP-grasp superfamily)
MRNRIELSSSKTAPSLGNQPHGHSEVIVSAQSEPLRRSIEVEYWVIDSEGRLVEPGTLVEASAGAEREFVEPLLEIKTTPCETTAELRDELFDRVGRVLRRADELDVGLVPLGTPIAAEEIRDIPSERTRVQDRIVGDDFEYVRHCAGTHIHVEQQPGREIDQLNTLIALDPALALVSTSPYFQGEHLAASARSELYRRLAYEGLAHQGELWRYVDDIDQWNRRLERRYEEFCRAAEAAGVDRRAIAANFEPESAVWTPVQLRAEFGTVEWRSPDTAVPSQVVRLADSIAGVVEQLRGAEVRVGGNTGGVTSDTIELPTFDAVLEYVDAAITDGLTSDSLRSYLGRMGFDVERFEPVTHELAGREPVDVAAARQLRLDHAKRLERDVLQAHSVGD